MIGVGIPAEGSWKYQGWCLKKGTQDLVYAKGVVIGGNQDSVRDEWLR